MGALDIRELKTGFQKFYFDSSLQGMRVGIALAFSLFALFGLLDNTPVQWLIRYALICPTLLITYALTFISAFEKYAQLIIAGMYFFISISLIMMMHYSQPGIQMQTYSFGLTLCIIGASAVRLRKKYTLPISILVVFIFCWMKRNDVVTLQLHFPILVSAIAITFLTISSTERILKSNYTAIILLETERKQLREIKEKLESADMMKSKLMSIVTHDLKAPNGNIIALLEMLGTKSISQGEFLHFSKRLRSQVINNQKLLDTLLKWSVVRIENKANVVKVNVRLIVQECIDVLDEFATRKGNLILNELEDRVILCDPDILRIVIRNIVCNAIKFTDSGTITVNGFTGSNQQFNLSITDTGIGMKPEFVNRLFNWNFRASTVGTKNEIGTGIGLLLCMELLQTLGGNLKINSIPGKGTHVTMLLNSPVIRSEPIANMIM